MPLRGLVGALAASPRTEGFALRGFRLKKVALAVNAAPLGNIADAEDVVQDAFLSAFTHLDQFRGQAKMSTWLTAIVINAARMKLRQRPSDESEPSGGHRNSLSMDI